MPLPKRPIGAAGVVVAIALLGAACGSGSADLDTAATTGSSVETAPADATTEGPAPTAEPSTTGQAAAEPEGPQPVPDHAFPDLDTVDIADGSTVNLADRLAGGDTPVLLWFWAPH
jgi:hypothetical protein